MRVLWLCNIMLPMIAEKLHMESTVKEGWLTGTLTRLIAEGRDGDITLAVAFPTNENMKNFHDVYVFNGTPVECFGYYEDMNAPEKYDRDLERRFDTILDIFKPDMIHIFGTEYPHALAMARAFQKPEKILVGMQGIITLCAQNYMAGLPEEECKKNSFRDWLKKDGLVVQQEKFEKRGEREVKTLRAVLNVTGRTTFDKQFCESVNEDIRYFPMNETMRSCFYEGQWSLDKCKKHQIFFSQADYPLKGFHHMLKAMPKVLEKYPDATLVVAGADIIHKPGILGFVKVSAYGQYLDKLIAENDLTDKIKFLGKLSAEEMKQTYLESHTFVCASSVENSPNSVAEAMLLGTPVVASNVGGIPSMITNEKDGLLFENGDVDGLADAVLRLWEESPLPLSNRLSKIARERAHKVHHADTNYARLLEIYRTITK